MEFSLDSSILFIHFSYLLIIQVLSHVCPSLSHVHQSFLMFPLTSLVSSHRLIPFINCSCIVIVALTYNILPHVVHSIKKKESMTKDLNTVDTLSTYVLICILTT